MDPLKPDPKAHEEARQNIGLLPFQHPVSEADAKAFAETGKLTPRDWAVRKGLLKLNRDRSIHYTTHTPWEYQSAFVVHRWPDPEIDPTFMITEEEFDEAIEAAVAGRSLEHHREEKKRERATLEKLSAQIDTNNRALAKSVRDNTPQPESKS